MQLYANAHPAALAALANPPLSGVETNEPGWRMAEIPAASGHGTALALATVLSSLVDGTERLYSAATLQAACAGQARSTDLVLQIPLEFGLGSRCPLRSIISDPTRQRSATTASAARRRAPTRRPGSPSPMS